MANRQITDLTELLSDDLDGTNDLLLVQDFSSGSAKKFKSGSTDAQKGLVELATDAETQTGTDASRAVTPASLSARSATESRTGLAEIATQAETDAGTDDSRFITAKKLAGKIKQATESLLGLVKIATQAQTDAGTDDTTAVTPKKLRWGFSSSFGISGYIVLPTWLGGLIVQWDQPSMQTTPDTFAFPLSFPNAVFAVVANDYGTGGGIYAIRTVNLDSLQEVQFDADTAAARINYIAIGH